jgi:hypothetical protein
MPSSILLRAELIERAGNVAYWHFSDMANAMTNVSFEGESGSGAGLVDAGAVSPVLPFRHSEVPWDAAVARIAAWPGD